MFFKNYTIIFRIIKSSQFLKTQALTLFIITYIDWTLIPFLTKLEGTYLPIYMISFYMLIGALDGFIQPIFKNIKNLSYLSLCNYIRYYADHKLFDDL